jgi:hypothetical protein
MDFYLKITKELREKDWRIKEEYGSCWTWFLDSFLFLNNHRNLY